MGILRSLFRVAAYLWAGPNTILGVFGGLVVICLGGQGRLVQGVVEFYGGLVGRLFFSLPMRCRISAITFGHVILSASQSELAAVRRHEHVHVRQYECWGPFFLPAYGISSLWQILRRRRAYRDNFFEQEAYAAKAGSESDDKVLKNR